jgi:hypothetical protein
MTSAVWLAAELMDEIAVMAFFTAEYACSASWEKLVEEVSLTTSTGLARTGGV